MRIARSVLLCFGVLTWLALSGAPGSAQDIGAAISDPKKLREILAGNTAFGVNRREGDPDIKWSEYHCQNGRSLYIYGLDFHRGRWWLEGDEVCYTYEDADPGENSCFRFYSAGNGSYDLTARDTPAGSYEVTLQGVVPGDPFRIQKLDGGSCEGLSS